MRYGPTANGFEAEPIPPRRSSDPMDDPRMSEEERRVRRWFRDHQDDPDVDKAREIDRRLNASRDPAEMAELIRQRRLVRAGLDFEAAMRAFEQAHPTRPDLPDSFPHVIR